MNLIETTKRVGVVAGQLGEREGDVVAQDVARAAHVDRDHHLECDRLLAAPKQIGAYAPRDGRQYHVVDVRRSSSGRWAQAKRRSDDSCPLSTLVGAGRRSWSIARIARIAPEAV